MYIQLPQPDKKCSKCNTINCTESVTIDNKTFLRCRICGHEKLISTIEVYPEDGPYKVYELKEQPQIEEF